MNLSALLDPSKPPKSDKATIVTEAAEIISALRKELAALSSSLDTLHKLNETREQEKSSLHADKAALVQDKIKLEHQLHCFMSHMPFASPQPGLSFPMPFAAPGAPPMLAPPGTKMAPNHHMPLVWSFPPLVVQSTTAEEDAKLRAPVA